jgi:hypothetical protein
LFIALLVVMVILVIVWMITVFNKLTGLNNQCREAWSNVDTGLRSAPKAEFP